MGKLTLRRLFVETSCQRCTLRAVSMIATVHKCSVSPTLPILRVWKESSVDLGIAFVRCARGGDGCRVDGAVGRLPPTASAGVGGR